MLYKTEIKEVYPTKFLEIHLYQGLPQDCPVDNIKIQWFADEIVDWTPERKERVVFESCKSKGAVWLVGVAT
ncbi:hypothetical protein J6590_101840 [Homalodisca vitripennis]|nr:hypothetical protein J6590_101840 [Homalodisca vitripennis]